MSYKHIGIQLLTVYMCLCQVLAEHPCGENPLRRFASLTRILNDLYPGREINPAMALLRDSNPELHRRLLPVVSRLESEWRLYTDCVTMVDNGYFKRSGLSSPAENGQRGKGHRNLKGNKPWSREAFSRSGPNDVQKGTFTIDESPVFDSTS
ncbi:unnamed protein product [Candidula unifasciata]|uniref:Uncharacterized protein n=1 Tax=Candidula unifasciata TaxID=100452 RepID=A0A8S3YSB3_9EUPU|nr:unnamed protein product [Candidula unifasciata]